jgi:hypothetical protein
VRKWKTSDAAVYRTLDEEMLVLKIEIIALDFQFFSFFCFKDVKLHIFKLPLNGGGSVSSSCGNALLVDSRLRLDTSFISFLTISWPEVWSADI